MMQFPLSQVFKSSLPGPHCIENLALMCDILSIAFSKKFTHWPPKKQPNFEFVLGQLRIYGIENKPARL